MVHVAAVENVAIVVSIEVAVVAGVVIVQDRAAGFRLVPKR